MIEIKMLVENVNIFGIGGIYFIFEELIEFVEVLMGNRLDILFEFLVKFM